MTERTSRDRFILAMASLLHDRGYAATSISDVLAKSGAPKGSLYFHFPGGKDELAAIAISHTAKIGREAFFDILNSAATLCAGFEAICDIAARKNETSKYGAANFLGAVAEEALNAPLAHEARANAIQSCLQVFEGSLKGAGVSARRAKELAVSIFCIIIGAKMLASALPSTEPFLGAKREIARVLESEGLPKRKGTRSRSPQKKATASTNGKTALTRKRA